MKKLSAVILALILMMSLSISVLADPSPENPEVVIAITDVVDANGDVYKAELGQTDAALISSATQSISLVIEEEEADDLQVIDAKEVTVPSDTVFPATITFAVNGVTANSKGYFLHWTGSEWEKITATFGSNSMTGTFSSLSPVAFVVDKETAEIIQALYDTGADGTQTNGSGTAADGASVPQSPQTGDTSADTGAVLMASICCLAAAGVFAVIYRKKFHN